MTYSSKGQKQNLQNLRETIQVYANCLSHINKDQLLVMVRDTHVYPKIPLKGIFSNWKLENFLWQESFLHISIWAGTFPPSTDFPVLGDMHYLNRDRGDWILFTELCLNLGGGVLSLPASIFFGFFFLSLFWAGWMENHKQGNRPVSKSNQNKSLSIYYLWNTRGSIWSSWRYRLYIKGA